jgi:predicted negative regulator of RcsB-dependent stress response
MAAYDLEEQEQLATLKAWWNQYGDFVSWAMIAVAVAVAGWQGWNWYQRNQAAQASAIFSVLQKAASERDMQRVKPAVGELLEKYSGTTYAPMAALLAGKAAFDSGDLKTAKAQFAWVVEHGKDELRDLGRLRLAAILIDEKAYDEALRHLGEANNTAFATRFAEMRGDALAAQGKKAEAKTAYAAAIEKIAAGSRSDVAMSGAAARAAYKQLLQQKSDALGESR